MVETLQSDMYSGLVMVQLLNTHTATFFVTTDEQLVIHTSRNVQQTDKGTDVPRDSTGRNAVQQVKHIFVQYYLGCGAVQVILCKFAV